MTRHGDGGFEPSRHSVPGEQVENTWQVPHEIQVAAGVHAKIWIARPQQHLIHTTESLLEVFQVAILSTFSIESELQGAAVHALRTGS